MFRTGLLVSTAMTAVTLLLPGAPVQAQTNMYIASHDPNTRFLCTYGQFRVSAQNAYLHSSDFFSHWRHVAVSVVGQGQTVSQIKVIEATSSYTYNPHFWVGIYNNTASGYPGSLITSGKGRATSICRRVQIRINPTTLERKTKYWVVEWVAPRRYSMTDALFWIADPKAKSKAYVQYYSKTVSGSSTSPWMEQSAGPYLTLK